MADPDRDLLRQLFAQNIERGMRRRRLNDLALADVIREADPKIRASAGQVYRWRTGKHAPSRRTLAVLVQVLFTGDWLEMLSDRNGHLWGGASQLRLTSDELQNERVQVADLLKRIDDLERRLDVVNGDIDNGDNSDVGDDVEVAA